MTKIRAMHKHFQQIKAQHIYRSYNQDVDRLSKEALILDEGGFYYSQVSVGQQESFEIIDINL